MKTQFPFVLAALLTAGVCMPAGAKDKVEIKSGVSGSYCVPFDSPQCRSFNTMEADRVFEKRQQERRIEDLERRERQRELEYRLERNRYKTEL